MSLITSVEEYLNMSSLVTATIGLVIAMLFIQGPRNRWARGLAVVLGASAIAVFFFNLRNTMGQPDPWLPAGSYNLIGWKTEEKRDLIYVMVSHPDFGTPRQYSIPFDLDLALKLQEIRRTSNSLEQDCLAFNPDRAHRPAAVYRLMPNQNLGRIDCVEIIGGLQDP